MGIILKLMLLFVAAKSVQTVGVDKLSTIVLPIQIAQINQPNFDSVFYPKFEVWKDEEDFEFDEIFKRLDLRPNARCFEKCYHENINNCDIDGSYCALGEIAGQCEAKCKLPNWVLNTHKWVMEMIYGKDFPIKRSK